MRSIDPHTGAPGRETPEIDLHEARALARAAAEAQRAWARRPLAERVRVHREAARLLRERADDLARLMAEEMGKPVKEGRSEAEKCAWACEHYAEHAGAYLADEPVETPASKSYVSYRPLGVVLAIMPWNFPLWQLFRFAAPALAAGNGVVLKHAGNVQGCAEAIVSIWRDAGLPEALIANLPLDHDAVEELIGDPAIAAVTLTGSTRAGRAIAAVAGRALKPIVLELGGSDPYVVLADADVPAAAEACAKARLVNSGQSCIAAKRFVVVDAVHDAFREHLVEHLQTVRVGAPLDEDTDVGPQAREDLRDDLHEQVQKSIAAGATLALGGEVPEGAGWYYPVTLLTDVGPGMPAYEEELFGPVAVMIRAKDEADALRIANDTPYGLGAAVFTGDAARGEELARDVLQAGCTFVNTAVRSDPRVPFGGIKDSGFGRELGRAGLLEFVNVKTVWVD